MGEFCSPFDEHLAASGSAAVFFPDHEGLLRFDAEWTRDAWGRAEGPHAPGWRWLLLRDHDTHYVQLALVTSPTLIEAHPRADVRSFEQEDDALAAWRALGPSRLRREPW